MYQGSENPSQGDGFAETISAIPSSVDQVNDQVKVSGSVDLVVASAVEAVRNALTSGLVSVNSYRLSSS